MRYSREITDYIYNQMSPLQREAFEQKLEMDPELAAEVREQQEMLDALHDARMYEEAMNDPHIEEAEKIAQEMLDDRKKDIPTKEKKVRRFSFRMLSAAAAAAILFLLDLLMGRMLSDAGLDMGSRKRLGIKKSMTKSFGKSIGKRYARSLKWFRRRFRKK